MAGFPRASSFSSRTGYPSDFRSPVLTKCDSILCDGHSWTQTDTCIHSFTVQVRADGRALSFPPRFSPRSFQSVQTHSAGRVLSSLSQSFFGLISASFPPCFNSPTNVKRTLPPPPPPSFSDRSTALYLFFFFRGCGCSAFVWVSFCSGCSGGVFWCFFGSLCFFLFFFVLFFFFFFHDLRSSPLLRIRNRIHIPLPVEVYVGPPRILIEYLEILTPQTILLSPKEFSSALVPTSPEATNYEISQSPQP